MSSLPHERLYYASTGFSLVASAGDHIVPIPGTKRMDRLQENLGALQVTITPEELAEIGKISPKGFAAGERYPSFS